MNVKIKIKNLKNIIMVQETKDKLRDFINALEDEYGNLRGIEIILDHPVRDGERQAYANIKELVVYYTKKQLIDLE